MLLTPLWTIPSIGLQSSSVSISFYGVINYSRFIEKGVNYLSLYHMYSGEYTTDDILRRDFSRFKQDGINVISLSLYWYRLEGHVRGSYDGIHPDGSPYGKRFLDDIKRVINIADEYNIKVLITFHTFWGDDSAWCTPDYVIDPVSGKNIGLAIVRSEEMKKAFIEMFSHTVSYLAGTKGIWAWAILNEPWYWGRTINEHDFVTENGRTQKENFILLIQELSSIVKKIDGRSVTVRFVNTHIWLDNYNKPRIKNIFIEDWNWDQRIFESLDFISFNVYIPSYEELLDLWRNMTLQNVNGCYQLNKEVWITEFGYNSDDDVVQTYIYHEILNFFTFLQINGVLAWFWRSDVAPSGWNEEPGKIGKGFNLCSSADGSPRPAYFEILMFPSTLSPQ